MSGIRSRQKEDHERVGRLYDILLEISHEEKGEKHALSMYYSTDNQRCKGRRRTSLSQELVLYATLIFRLSCAYDQRITCTHKI